jgi:hypothetical protein
MRDILKLVKVTRRILSPEAFIRGRSWREWRTSPYAGVVEYYYNELAE